MIEILTRILDRLMNVVFCAVPYVCTIHQDKVKHDRHLPCIYLPFVKLFSGKCTEYGDGCMYMYGTWTVHASKGEPSSFVGRYGKMTQLAEINAY